MRQSNTQLDRLDLKALRMLAALLDTASITVSGEQLGLSQPAASRVVARLRKVFNDPLLVRNTKGYVLTASAEELRPLVGEVLAALGRMADGVDFEPTTARRTFRIAATDYGSVTVIGPLAAKVAHAAPGVCLDVVPYGTNTFAELESGALDFALDGDIEGLPADFHYRELFHDDYACLLRREHPCLKGEGDLLARLATAPQAITMYPEGVRMLPDEVLNGLGVTPKVTSLRTPYFMSTPWIIAESDLVLCVPRRAAERSPMWQRSKSYLSRMARAFLITWSGMNERIVMLACSGSGASPRPACSRRFLIPFAWRSRPCRHFPQTQGWLPLITLAG